MSRTDSGAEDTGLLGSLRRALSTVVEIVKTRIELVATEIEEQKVYTTQLIVLSFLALFFFCLAVIFATLTVVIIYWDRNPVAVVGGFAVMYLVLAILLGLIWRAREKARPRFLAATLNELERDREELTRR